VEARQAGSLVNIGAWSRGGQDRPACRAAQAAAGRGERGPHGAPIARGPAPQVHAAVRRAGERASRGGAPPVAACRSRVAGSRHRGVHLGLVGGRPKAT
jgi:hypothetical protein